MEVADDRGLVGFGDADGLALVTTGLEVTDDRGEDVLVLVGLGEIVLFLVGVFDGLALEVIEARVDDDFALDFGTFGGAVVLGLVEELTGVS